MQKRRFAIFAALCRRPLLSNHRTESRFGVFIHSPAPRGRRRRRRSSRAPTASSTALRPTAATSRSCPPTAAAQCSASDASGAVTTLHTFRGPEGAWPKSLIQARDGFFYGTATTVASRRSRGSTPGSGRSSAWTRPAVVTVLHVFPYRSAAGLSAEADRAGCRRCPLRRCAGTFGTSAIGGYVYRFDPVTGGFRHLHDFVGSDGEIPTGPLFQAVDGFFYGTTNQGGPWNSGVVYKVDVLGHFVLLHSLSPLFPGEGSEPKGGVIQASDGFFYGTTEQGGYGGEIFRMDAAGNYTVIHRFDAYASDGGRPRSGLIEGRDGFLYGTATIGGQPVTASRHGVVYRMDKAGNVTVVHTFTGPDGYEPWAALVQAADGGLYGSTVIGGASGSECCSASTPPPRPAARAGGTEVEPSSVVGGRPLPARSRSVAPRRQATRSSPSRAATRRLSPSPRRLPSPPVRRAAPSPSRRSRSSGRRRPPSSELQRQLASGDADDHSLIRAALRRAVELLRSQAAAAADVGGADPTDGRLIRKPIFLLQLTYAALETDLRLWPVLPPRRMSSMHLPRRTVAKSSTR